METYFNQNNSQIICPYCLKIFSTKKNLSNHHMTFHSMKFPFVCTYPYCSKAYSISSRLKVHMHTHETEKPYNCSQCNKCFREKGYLKTHMKFHSPRRSFACSICSKTYKTKGHLKDHILVQHEGVKKYECTICYKCFGRSSTLKSHKRTHTGEKTIKCYIDICNHYFSEKGNMEIHYKRHLKRVQKSNDMNKSIESNTKTQIIEVNDNDYNDNNGNVTRPCSNDVLSAGIEKIKTEIFLIEKRRKKRFSNLNNTSNYTLMSHCQSDIIQYDHAFILSNGNLKINDNKSTSNMNEIYELNEFRQSQQSQNVIDDLGSSNNNSFLSSLF